MWRGCGVSAALRLFSLLGLACEAGSTRLKHYKVRSLRKGSLARVTIDGKGLLAFPYFEVGRY